MHGPLRGQLGIKPHTALASLYEMVRCLIFFIDFREIVAKVYDHGIAVHPVIHFRELVYDVLLYFVDSHN